MWEIIAITILIHPCSISTSTSKLVYPDDPLLQNRQQEDHEKSIESVISKGILNLTLATSRLTTSVPLLHPNENQFQVFGPVSITGALSLLLLGSFGNTFTEIVNVMGLSSEIDTQNKYVHEQLSKVFTKLVDTSGFDIGQQISFANGLFIQNNFPIYPAYQRASQILYKSEVLNLDFENDPLNAQNVINHWVSAKTNGKISTLLELPPLISTKLLLASVLYFKASWEQPFIKGLTKWHPFFNHGKQRKSDYKVEFMTAAGYYPHFRDSNYEIIGFPYKGNKTTLYAIIPENSSQEKLQQLEYSLTINDVQQLLNNLKTVECAILFPKMKLESSIDLSPTLYKMGLRTLFEPSLANLDLISPGRRSQQPYTNNRNDFILFSRVGEPSNCANIFNSSSDINACEQNAKAILYKRNAPRSGQRSDSTTNTSPDLLKLARNSGLYVDKVLHKVYMDITETGTEAAAATGVSLTRSGDKVIVRVDVPFLFFILHEERKS